MVTSNNTETKIALLASFVVGILIVAYSFTFEDKSNTIYATLLYTPLVVYAFLALLEKAKDTHLETFNYALMAIYAISFLQLLVKGSEKLTSYGVIIFIIPIIVLGYVATEKKINVFALFRSVSSVAVFFAVNMFLPYEWHVCAFVALNAAILTYFVFDHVKTS